MLAHVGQLCPRTKRSGQLSSFGHDLAVVERTFDRVSETIAILLGPIHLSDSGLRESCPICVNVMPLRLTQYAHRPVGDRGEQW